LSSLGLINTDFLHTGHSTNIEGPNNQQSFKERPTVVVIHGWMNNFDESIIGLKFGVVAKAFKNRDVNIVRVVWFAGVYDSAVAEVPGIAKTVAAYLDKNLGEDQSLWKKLTIVGHSLGAHVAGENRGFQLGIVDDSLSVAGFIGKQVKNGKVGTIIGLDAAGANVNPEKVSSSGVFSVVNFLCSDEN
jgi:hypothetical protein